MLQAAVDVPQRPGHGFVVGDFGPAGLIERLDVLELGQHAEHGSFGSGQPLGGLFLERRHDSAR